jgi:hypothetical protein
MKTGPLGYCQADVKAILSQTRGTLTLFALFMTVTLILVFASLAAFGARHTKHAETLRTLSFASQSLLHTYDRSLLERYSLPAVDLSAATPEAYLEKPLNGRRWSYEPSELLSEPDVFIRSMRTAVVMGVSDSVLKSIGRNFSERSEQRESATSVLEALKSVGAMPNLELEAHIPGTASESDAVADKDLSQATLTLALQAVSLIREIEAQPEPSWENSDGREIDTDRLKMLSSRRFKDAAAPLLPDERLFLTVYATRHFKNRVSDDRAPIYGHKPEKTFFESAEMEYILYGHTSELMNTSRAYGDLFLLRLAGNVVHILSCEDKRRVIGPMSDAVLAVFGVPPQVTSAGLTLAWGTLESRSDMARLLEGERLPWRHTSDTTWRTGVVGNPGLEKTFAHSPDAGTSLAEGGNYGEHLALLLMMKAQPAHVLRIMDLIALNLGGAGSPLDLSLRGAGHRIRVEAGMMLPEVLLEDGYGLD